jgi:hypothetical protein
VPLAVTVQTNAGTSNAGTVTINEAVVSGPPTIDSGGISPSSVTPR